MRIFGRVYELRKRGLVRGGLPLPPASQTKTWNHKMYEHKICSVIPQSIAAAMARNSPHFSDFF